MRKVVIDTNVLVSSLFGGRPREVMNLWRDGQFLLCLSDEIVAEYLQVLVRFGEVKQEAQEFLALLNESENVLFVTPAERIHEVAADAEDDKFLECGVTAGAEVIVSGDHHLLELGRFRDIAILEPTAFLASFRGQ